MIEQPMPEDAARRMQDFNEAQTDWHGWCSKCKKELTGTLKELREHICGTEA